MLGMMRQSTVLLGFAVVGEVLTLPTSTQQSNPLLNLRERDLPMCGSSTGISCGMNVCCSGANYCGTSSAHCTTGTCQPGYGSCTLSTPQKCGKTSGTTNGRTVGYYRGAGASVRSCHVVAPDIIDTSKFTHLNYAFTTFDSNYNVIAQDSADEPIYSKFTSLKSDKLETWIAIGGGGGNTPWSSMVTARDNRAKFITSLKAFIVKYGFQGVDLDWEVPSTATDRDGYTSLAKELRASFGTTYKISMAFPADYGDMFYIDAKGMEPYLDFINYMSYDLRNVDQSIAAHTNIVKIEEKALPFWFSGIPASKLNLGLASYGRGFTITSQTCSVLNCPFTRYSVPGSCIPDSTGVMSLFDIQDLIAVQSLSPSLDSTGMFKSITYDDNQWAGYDDAETVALKKEWGNDFCFGGTMQWAVDLGSF